MVRGSARITRRSLLGAATALIPAATLVACATGAPSQSQLVSDVALIGSGIGALEAAIRAAGIAVPANITAGIDAAIADVQANAGQVSDALGNSNATILQKIMSGLGVVANILAPFFPQAQLAYSIVSAAVALGQYLLNMFQSGAAHSLRVVPTHLIPYSPNEARAVLKGA